MQAWFAMLSLLLCIVGAQALSAHEGHQDSLCEIPPAQNLPPACPPIQTSSSAHAETWTVVVLTQRRPSSLARLLRSIVGANLTGTDVGLTISVDGLPSVAGVLSAPSVPSGQVPTLPQLARAKAARDEVVALAASAVEGWQGGGPVILRTSEDQVGLRHSWIGAHCPAHQRDYAIILEDDIEVGEDFLQYAMKTMAGMMRRSSTKGSKPFSALSLSPRILNAATGRPFASSAATPQGGPHASPHVSTWGVVPVPEVWAEFLQWYHTQDTFARCPEILPGAEGLKLTEWYGADLAAGRGASMWSLHWTVFMSDIATDAPLMMLYPNEPGAREGHARSWQDDGEHYHRRAGKSNELLGPRTTLAAKTQSYPHSVFAVDDRRIHVGTLKSNAAGSESYIRSGRSLVNNSVMECPADRLYTLLPRSLGLQMYCNYTYTELLDLLTNRTIIFIGDSITREIFAQLVCAVANDTLCEVDYGAIGSGDDPIPGTGMSPCVPWTTLHPVDGSTSISHRWSCSFIFLSHGIRLKFYFIQRAWGNWYVPGNPAGPGIPELAAGALSRRDAIVANSGHWDFNAHVRQHNHDLEAVRTEYVSDMTRLANAMRLSGATILVRLGFTYPNADDGWPAGYDIRGQTAGRYLDFIAAPLARAMANRGIPTLDPSCFWAPPDAYPDNTVDGFHPKRWASHMTNTLMLNKLSVEWARSDVNWTFDMNTTVINRSIDIPVLNGYSQAGLRPLGSGNGVSASTYSYSFNEFCPSGNQLWFLAILATTSIALGVALYDFVRRKGPTTAPAPREPLLDVPVPPTGTAPGATTSWQQAVRQFAVILTITSLAWFGNDAMPAAYRPAARIWDTENTDLWIASILCLLGTSIFSMEELPAKKAKLLSREQTDEWKGWMQVAFVMYHYSNSDPTYPAIRAFVSAYVWMTGFGHSIYCWKTGDFSVKRFAKSMWRMNFLVALLSAATGTQWILYYVCALHSLFFMLVYFSLWVGVTAAKRSVGAARDSRTSKLVGIATMMMICIIVWEVHGIYDAALGPFLRWAFGDFFDEYFLFRTEMDRYSSVFGMMYAAVHTDLVKRKWPSTGSFSTALLMLQAAVCAVLVACWLYVWVTEYDSNDKSDYLRLHPYVGMLWVPGYIMLRNCHPWLTAHVSRPMMFFGRHSLELYLLQFHLFLNRGSENILMIIPNDEYALTNMVLAATLMCVLAPPAFRGAQTVLQAVSAHPMRVIGTAGCTLLVGFIVLDAVGRKNSGSCTSAASWGISAAFVVVQVVVGVWCHRRLIQPQQQKCTVQPEEGHISLATTRAAATACTST